jgi:hypothetical protein
MVSVKKALCRVMVPNTKEERDFCNYDSLARTTNMCVIQ